MCVCVCVCVWGGGALYDHTYNTDIPKVDLVKVSCQLNADLDLTIKPKICLLVKIKCKLIIISIYETKRN